MKTTRYIAAASLLALMSACSSEDLLDQSYQQDPLAVHIIATAGKNVIARSNPTDDTKQTAFNDGDRISVAAEGQNAVVYTKSGDSWNPESGYLKWTKTQLSFEAYYPVGVNNASMTSFTVPADQSTLDKIKEADYMTFSDSKDKPSSADGTINIEMNRKMARVVIDKIEFNDQYETGYSVTSIKVHGNTSGYLNDDLNDGSISVESYKTTDSKFYALLSPTTEAVGTEFLTITVKANDAEESDPGTLLTVKGIPELKSGYSYSYTLTVGKNKAEISSVTVKDWNDGGSVIEGDGDAEKYEMTYSVSKSGNGVVAINIDPSDATDAKPIAELGIGLTGVVVTNNLNTMKQDILAEALSTEAAAPQSVRSADESESKIILYLPKVSQSNLSKKWSELTDIITVICGKDATEAVKGDIAMLDGFFLPVADLNSFPEAMKTIVLDLFKPAGVVFWTTAETTTAGRMTPANLTDDKIMHKNFPHCTHGLIVSLDNVTTCIWQNNTTNENIYWKFQKDNNTYSKYAKIAVSGSYTEYSQKIVGYNNTEVLRAYNNEERVKNDNNLVMNPVADLDKWENIDKAPKNTTGWYIPSVKEIHMLIYKDVDKICDTGVKGTDTKQVVNSSLSVVGGVRLGNGYLWSSSEYYEKDDKGYKTYSVDQVWAVNINDGQIDVRRKTNSYYVRAVCAF